MFPPLVIRDPAISRESLVRYLEDHQIETGFLLPLINQPVFAECSVPWMINI
jgi:hypothetical protein